MLSLVLKNRDAGDELVRMVDAVANPGSGEVRKVATAVRQAYAENFSKQGSAAGPWAPLAPSTVADRILKGFPGSAPILRRTGSYQDSFTNPNNADHISEVERTASGWTLAEGSQDIRTTTLNNGYAPRNIPARPVDEFDAGQQARISDVVALLVEQVRKREVG